MRIAAWNVNSLKARLERLGGWLERTAPDVLLVQETKLTDADAPRDFFAERGYELAHHGEGGKNGVAIASKVGLADVRASFEGDPCGEARALGATCGGVRFVSIYAPNGRAVGSPTYVQKLAWYVALAKWLAVAHRPDAPLVVGGDFNVAPDDRDVWDPEAAHGGTHVSAPERAAFETLVTWGLVDAYRRVSDRGGRYTWWDYRAGDFYKNHGMRIDHVLVTRPLAGRVVFAEIDREARKGKPTPSDHAPVVVDLDAPGRPFDGGWEGAEKRIAERLAKAKAKAKKEP